MKILITRPRADAEALADALAARGFDPVIAPMLDITPTGAALPDLTGVQALIFTSANGVRAFAGECGRRDLAVFTVGDATARAAKAEGFAEVTSAGRDAAALAQLVTDRLSPADGALLHVCGGVVTGALAERLAAAGFTVIAAALYDAVPARALPPGVEQDLRAGTIGWVLFFSPRTARSFDSLIAASGDMAALRTATAKIGAVCLSPAVAGALAPRDWRQVVTAAAPTQPALIEALDRAVKYS